MTLKDIVQEVVTREGKKSHVAIGDVREIVRILCEIEMETEGAVSEAIDEAVLTETERKLLDDSMSEPDFGLGDESGDDDGNDPGPLPA